MGFLINPYNFAAAGVGGWVELGRTTLGSASDTITVSSLANKRYLMILGNTYSIGGQIRQMMRLNSDTGNNYSYRGSADGASDGTSVSRSNMPYTENNENVGEFSVSYISNYATKEKLSIGHTIGIGTAGAGTAPSRTEHVNKHVQTSNPISALNFINPETGDYASGSELVVLGWDPADTHTTNFWTELASVNATGSSQNLSSGTITAKKYLWVQTYCKGQTADVNMIFNNDTGATYARRYSSNGGADLTNASQTSLSNMPTNGATTPSLCNFFIINVSANEKLCFGQVISQNTAGAGTAPTRLEWACKWANTAAQITEIDLDSQTTNFSSDSMIKVYGSN